VTRAIRPMATVSTGAWTGAVAVSVIALSSLG
jgi:hypothetical protein